MIVIADKSGQLANRLFVFAAFIACGLENRLLIVNPSFEEYAQYFVATQNDLFCRYPPKESLVKPSGWSRRFLYQLAHHLTNFLSRWFPATRFWHVIKLAEGESCRLSEAAVLSLVKDKTIFAQGWLFQDHDHVIRHGDTIRAFFSPIDSYRRAVNRQIEDIRGVCDVLVGVHIRRGDYKEFAGGKYCYSPEQYAVVMRQLKECFPQRKVTFLISSNERQELSSFHGLHCIIAPGDFLEDLLLLAQCDYIVGPPSTYNMWASFFGKVPLYIMEDPTVEPALDKFIPVLTRAGLGR